jgi:hypothetical protein
MTHDDVFCAEYWELPALACVYPPLVAKLNLTNTQDYKIIDWESYRLAQSILNL